MTNMVHPTLVPFTGDHKWDPDIPKSFQHIGQWDRGLVDSLALTYPANLLLTGRGPSVRIWDIAALQDKNCLGILHEPVSVCKFQGANWVMLTKQIFVKKETSFSGKLR